MADSGLISNTTHVPPTTARNDLWVPEPGRTPNSNENKKYLIQSANWNQNSLGEHDTLKNLNGITTVTLFLKTLLIDFWTIQWIQYTFLKYSWTGFDLGTLYPSPTPPGIFLTAEPGIRPQQWGYNGSYNAK